MQDFEVGTDIIDFTATPLNFDDITLVDSLNGLDVQVRYGSDLILLKNTRAADLDASSFAFSNLAPVMAGDAALAAINEDSTGDGGQSLAALFAAQASDADGTITGFAISAINADPVTEGTSQVSLDGGANFILLDNPGFVTPTAALAIDTSIVVRFVPVTDFSGTPGALTVHALDNTYTAGFSGLGGQFFVDTTTGGGLSAISAASGDVTIVVNPLNDAPEVAGPVSLTEVNEASKTHAATRCQRRLLLLQRMWMAR